MRSQDLSKQDLYEGVKTLIEEENNHIILPQQKIFTLFSIAFQYLLYTSTKKAGAYIIRIEDSALAEKISKRAKDPSTRKFLQSLMVPRKFKYGQSTFYLDFFHIGSWSLTSDIPKSKIQAALIVKNTNDKPMTELDTEEEEEDNVMANLPEDYFLTSLAEFVPKTVTIAYGIQDHEFLKEISFPFVKKEKERLKGFTISKNIDLDSIEE